MFKNVLISLRAHFWVLSIIPALAGAYLANNHTIDLQVFALVAIMIGPGLSGISEIINDYADRETDAQQNLKRIWRLPFSGGSGAIMSGGITKRETIAVTAILSVITFAIAFYLGPAELAIVIAGMFVALQYSLGPLHAKTRGIIGPLLFATGFRGVISFHAGWLAFAPATNQSMVTSIFLGLLFFATFTISHLADYNEDKRLRINTMPVQLGFDKAQLIAGGFFATGLAWLAIAYSSNIISVNFLVAAWLPLALLFLYRLASLKNNRNKIMSLVPLAMLVICTAPLIFV